jgi:hypothetical protein
MDHINILAEWDNAVKRWREGVNWGYQTWLACFGLKSPYEVANGE